MLSHSNVHLIQQLIFHTASKRDGHSKIYQIGGHEKNAAFGNESCNLLFF